MPRDNVCDYSYTRTRESSLMVEDKEESVAKMRADAYRKDRKLDEKLSNENPDRVGRFNRQADRKRETYSTENYYESVSEEEKERKTGPG